MAFKLKWDGEQGIWKILSIHREQRKEKRENKSTVNKNTQINEIVDSIEMNSYTSVIT